MEIKTINLDKFYFPEGEDSKKIGSGNNGKFSQFLKDALNKVNELQLIISDYGRLLATGELDNLHDIAIAQEKANISLQLTLGIRNKIVEAYREIMRIQI
ncbi:MAG: flagellar hook-basal body complex protein FliE [Tissierellia bacterium]|nr:flagellar hook-basal body complex protein FliE [Tissierellia bacterium]